MRQIRDIVSAPTGGAAWSTLNVRSAPRAYIYFEIQRDGSVANESVKRIQRGPTTLDRSEPARHSRLPDSLPCPEAKTRALTVEFYFEYFRGSSAPFD